MAHDECEHLLDQLSDYIDGDAAAAAGGALEGFVVNEDGCAVA